MGEHLTLVTNEHTMVASYEQQEDAAFRQEVDSVKQWFTSPRFKGLVRPYTAEQVVSKRGTLPISYPSNEMGKKLFRLLSDKARNGDTSHTYGALDPVQVTQMAKYLDTVYVSGWQSSSTASSARLAQAWTPRRAPSLSRTSTTCARSSP